VIIPPSLDHLRRHQAGSAWLDALPDLVTAAAQRWSVSLGDPFDDAYDSIAIPATLPDRTPVVVKLQWPNRDNAFEGAALRLWNGNGAVRILDEDDARHALLLERCEPGTTLAGVGFEQALAALIDLLPRLWIPIVAGFPMLAAESVVLSDELGREWERTGRPFERSLVDLALDAFATLPSTQGPAVLLHQDLHGDNILRAERGWLAIDPKPLLGERECGIAPIVRSAELGHSRAAVLRRFDRLTVDLGLERERARLWTIAHTISWSFDGDGTIASHVDTARWLAERR
jgi:streptomycin 6-kinase